MFRGFSGKSKSKFRAGSPPAGSRNGDHLHSILVTDCSQIKGSDYPFLQKLLSDGRKVTILDISPPGLPHRSFAGCSYHRLAGSFKETNWYIQMQSLLAYHWLREQKANTIFFHHGFAAAFYSCMARFLGLAFQGTPIAIKIDAPHALKLERAMEFPSGRNDFEIDYMERRAVTLSDSVTIEKPDAAEFMNETGWEAPVKKKPVSKKPVFITVCVATYNRPKWLREALASLEKQTLKRFEVIVVDDGSTDTGVDALRKELAPQFAAKKWRWVKQRNKGPAAARNYAATLAKGEYLLFMDDDDISYPDELERFALAAQRGGDVINCIIGMHAGTENGFPPTAQLPERAGKGTRPVGWTPIGGNLVIAAFINVAGFAHALYKRSTFKKLGGFPSGRDSVFEDYELLTKMLIKGCRIDVVPEVLMLYRRTKQSRSMGQDIFHGHLNSLKLLADQMPTVLQPLLLTLRSDWYQRHKKRRDGA